MEIHELLQEYGYNSEETPIVTGSALYALEVLHFVCMFCMHSTLN